GHEQVAQPVALGPEPWVEGDRGPVLLHHGRPVDMVPWPQIITSINRCIDKAPRGVEADRPGRERSGGSAWARGGQGAEGGDRAGGCHWAGGRGRAGAVDRAGHWVGARVPLPF